jgi:hypothetical protein
MYVHLSYEMAGEMGGNAAAAYETQRQGRCSSASASVTDPTCAASANARRIPTAGKFVLGIYATRQTANDLARQRIGSMFQP